MSKHNEKKRSMDKNFRILIENCDFENGEYKLGKQEILNVNRNELKEVIQNLPCEDIDDSAFITFDPQWDIDTENPIIEFYLEHLENEDIKDCFNIKLITENFVVTNNDKTGFEFNHRDFKFLILKMPVYTEKKVVLFDDYTESKFYKKLGKTSFLKALIKFILPLIIPGLFLFFLLWAFPNYINQFGFNYIFILFWGWLFILALINLFYSINFHYKKEKLEYYTPILNQFRPINLSGFIILITLFLGLLYFIAFFLISGYISERSGYLEQLEPLTEEELMAVEAYVTYFFLILVVIFIVQCIRHREDIAGFIKDVFYIITAPFWIVYIRYMFNREKKYYILHILNKKIQETENWDSKNYLLQLILEIEKTPIISINVFSKLIALLTFLLSVLPPFFGQFF